MWRGVLALQAAAQDLDGGGRVVSGAQVAQARRGHGAGAALQHTGGGRAGQRRRRGGVERERRLSGGVRARSSGGAGATVREEDENCCVKLTRGARGRVK